MHHTKCYQATRSLSGRSVRAVPSRTCRRRILCVRAAKRHESNEKADVQSQAQWSAPVSEEQEGNPYASPYGNSQYYQQYPQYPTQPPPSSGPPFGWIAFGAVLAIVGTKIWSFFSPSNGGPQAKMMNFMMQQAMKNAGGSAGQGGFPDFSKMSGAGSGGFPPGFPGGFNPSQSPSKPSSPAFDAQARDVTSPTGRDTAASSPAAEASASMNAGEKPGQKFQELKAQGSRRRRRQQPSGASFTDVEQEEASTSAEGPSANPSVTPDGVEPPPNGQSSGQVDMLESFLQDPKMQELLYQYLPEGMRNKETFDWMLKNPEYRQQLQSMIDTSGANLNPDLYKHMKGINSEQVTEQLAQLGMTPSDVVQKIMGDPELSQAFAKPKVQQAVLDLQEDKMAILKYQNDPEVMMVLEKMGQLFPNIQEQ